MARSWTHRVGTVLLSAGAIVGLTAVPSSAGGGAGSTGAGDPYFPLQGNGGYDVAHYDLTLVTTPATGRLEGTAAIAATATQQLRSFDLDLRRALTVSAVTVDGRPASLAQPASLGQEVVVTPAAPVRAGVRFTVVVRYAGVPAEVTDPDGSVEGWVRTADGAFVVNEPQGSPGWYPCNDTPTDKATYDFHVTVPAGLTAVANGELERGAMTLQALRVRIGDDDAFLGLLHDWQAAHRYGNARVEDFVAFTVARFPEVPGLQHFFQVWLYDPGKPANW